MAHSKLKQGQVSIHSYTVQFSGMTNFHWTRNAVNNVVTRHLFLFHELTLHTNLLIRSEQSAKLVSKLEIS